MRFLAALAFLLLGATCYAHHTAEHVLRYPSFHAGHVYRYDFTVNMTAGVPGLSPQVSKAHILAEVTLHAKNETDLILKFRHVDVSGSLPAVWDKEEILDVSHSSALEKELNVPTLVKYENGKVVGYSMPPGESVAAQKIRRSLLRSLEVYLDEQYINGNSREWPINYNLTRKSPAGFYKSHYTVTASPDVEYPDNLDVFNITRYDNFEGIPYIAYKYHHNFDKQGCPEVCKKEHVENRFGAGCPTGQEPHHGLIKRSFGQRHNLKYTQIKNDLDLVIDRVHTKETHLAQVYDQGLEVTVDHVLQFESADHEKVSTDDVSGQQMKFDLEDLEDEVQEEAWEEECKFPDDKQVFDSAVTLLEEITDIVLENDASSQKSKEVGHKIVTLQKYMQNFKVEEFKRFKERTIKSYNELSNASDKDKIKRQIWLDILPTIGTPEAVTFIVTHVSESINGRSRGISFWEAKSLIEALPQNIHHPNKKTVTDLMRLLEVAKEQTGTGYTLFYSAAYLSVARVIRKSCAYPLPEQSEEVYQQSSEQEKPSLKNLWRSRSSQQQSDQQRLSNSDKWEMFIQCPEDVANEFIEKTTNLLLTTTNKAKRVIYIEALAMTGLPQVLPTLKKYVHGDWHERHFAGLSPSYVDYLKTSTIFALHHHVGRSPQQVKDILIPVFFNVTQHPKIRTAAFSVIVKSQPSLALLEQVASLSWKEPSQEVASYVTSSFDSFGNSSLPCYQILSNRFKKVYPQLKRYDGGLFRSKNILLDMWDDLTSFGLEKRYDYIPSNESFIPSVIYNSIGYNLGNLKDYVHQFAAQVQGVSTRHIYNELFRHFGWTVPADIPKETEEKIFDNVDIDPRDPEPWKAILYQKIFYTTSYYYLDKELFNGKNIAEVLLDLFRHYTKMEGGKLSGHLIKLYIPTAFHTKSIVKALPFPVQFEMRSPILFSLKFKAEKEIDSAQEERVWKINAQPAVYHSHIYSNEILNLQDCKRVGAYYEQKTALVYPFIAKVGTKSTGEFIFSYKVPELPKTVISHRAEAGTYAGKKYYAPIPPTEERKTIKTHPVQFKYPLSFQYPHLPAYEGEVKTEDLQFGLEPIPRNWQEAALYIHRFYLNAGWRRRSMEIRRVPVVVNGYPSDELRYELNYWRNYKTVNRGDESNWSRDLKFDDYLNERDTSRYAEEGRKIYEKLSSSLSHIRDNFNLSAYHKVQSQMVKVSDIALEYYHTFGGYLHLVHLNSTGKDFSTNKNYEFTSDYAIGFKNMPNEFKYNKKYGEQKGIAIFSTGFGVGKPFSSPFFTAKAVFDYRPLAEYLPIDTEESVELNAFESDTHEECLEDTKQGFVHSPACIKAIREKSLYNHARLQAVWNRETPEYLKTFANYVELAMRYSQLSHVSAYRKPYTQRGEGSNSFSVEATYVDKMTDEPLLDISVEKFREIVNYTMINAGNIRPLSSIESFAETYAHAFTNNTYPATCSLTGKYVRTYDMQVYKMPESSCTYVLSAHCTEHKKFAVFAKYNSEGTRVEGVHVHLGDEHIVLQPSSGSSYTFKYNGKSYTLKTLQHALLNETARISVQAFQTNDGDSYIKVHAGVAGVQVYYDGEYIKVQVMSRFKGELCGLCSEYDGEMSREFRGTDRCLYKEAEHFARSAIVGQCGGRKLKGRDVAICDNEEATGRSVKTSSEEQDNEGYEPEIKRNIVKSRGSKLCFSTKPVPVCENNAQPMMVESREVDFHCLPKQDVHARKMVTESKRRILGELETKAVDYTETVQVAKMC